jgi:hypothetical protein
MPSIIFLPYIINAKIASSSSIFRLRRAIACANCFWSGVKTMFKLSTGWISSSAVSAACFHWTTLSSSAWWYPDEGRATRASLLRLRVSLPHPGELLEQPQRLVRRGEHLRAVGEDVASAAPRCIIASPASSCMCCCWHIRAARAQIADQALALTPVRAIVTSPATSGLSVPIVTVASFPVSVTVLVGASVPTEPVPATPVTATSVLGASVPTDPVPETPVNARDVPA